MHLNYLWGFPITSPFSYNVIRDLIFRLKWHSVRWKYSHLMPFSFCFSENFHSSRYSIKKSCSHEIITHGSEVCLHPYPLYSCHHGVCKSEHALHECIWMFHQWPDAWYPEVPADALHGKIMSPNSTIHCTIDAFAFRAEVSLVPVTYDSGKGKINLWIMDICRCNWQFFNDLDLVCECMLLVPEVMLMILCCRCTVSGSACFSILSSGLALFFTIWFNEWCILHSAFPDTYSLLHDLVPDLV